MANPSRRAWIVVAGMLFCAAGSGCSAPLRLEHSELLQSVPDEGLLNGAFSASSRILSGFDAVDADERWRVGDQILYGLQISNGNVRTVRFMLVELRTRELPGDAVIVVMPHNAPDLEDPQGNRLFVRARRQDDLDGPVALPAQSWSMTMKVMRESGEDHRVTRQSGSVLVAVYLFDGSGLPLCSGFTLAPEAYLRRGFYEACKAAKRRPEPPAQQYSQQADAIADVFPALYALGQMIEDTPNLGEILRAIVPIPSLMSIVLHGGVDFSVKGNLGEVTTEDRRMPALGSGGEGRPNPREALRFPIDIDMNGRPALQCLLTVVPSDAPYQLCGGVIGLDGVQTQKPDRHFILRLLAARRGQSHVSARVAHR